MYLQEELAAWRWRKGLGALWRYELPPEVSRARFIWLTGARPVGGALLRRLGLRGARQARFPAWLAAAGREVASESTGPSWLDAETGPVRSFLARTLHLRRTSFELAALEQVAARRQIEVRLPFMHRRLIEFAFEVPTRFVIAGSREKHLLLSALTGKLAPAVERRRSRTYFSAPFMSRIRELQHLFEAHDWILWDSDLIDRVGIERLRRERAKESSLRQLLGLYMADRFVATLKR